MALQNHSIFHTWKNINQQYKNNKLKTIAPTWNDKFESPDGSYAASSIQDYIERIIKNMKRYRLILFIFTATVLVTD